MNATDLAFVVHQHRHHFPDGFFARLGTTFLTEYYRAFISGEATCTMVAELEGERAGFLVGVSNPPVHRDHVVQGHGRALILKAVMAMLLHPSLAFIFLRTRITLYARKLLRRTRSAGQNDPAAGGAGDAQATTGGAASTEESADNDMSPGGNGAATAVLTHVAVVPAAQSCGIGSALIERFDTEVAAAGCERITLVTASGDDGAGPYYRRRGWQARGERRTPDGLRLTTYERAVGVQRESTNPSRSEDTA